MQDNGKLSSTWMSFTSVLTLIFVVLKILGIIEWSWIWVFGPIWISTLIVFVVITIIFGLPRLVKWFRRMLK